MNTLDLLKQCDYFIVENISNEDRVKWFKENVMIEKYCSLTLKLTFVSVVKDMVLDYFANSEEFIDTYAMYEKEKKLSCLELYLPFFNRKDIIEEKYKNQTNQYNLIMNSGLYDYIKKNCGKDFELYEEMFKEYINLDYMLLTYKLEKVLTNIPQTQDLVQLVQFFNDNQEIIEKMGSIVSDTKDEYTTNN